MFDNRLMSMYQPLPKSTDQTGARYIDIKTTLKLFVSRKILIVFSILKFEQIIIKR